MTFLKAQKRSVHRDLEKEEKEIFSLLYGMMEVIKGHLFEVEDPLIPKKSFIPRVRYLQHQQNNSQKTN